jgi:uncharacterized membrane protein
MKKLNTKSKLITFVNLLALAWVCALSVTAKVNPTFAPINFSGATFTRADDRSFVFSAIDFPGASFTQALGINPGGDVVGLYRDATGKQHGFLLSGEIFTSIDFPGAVATNARGIGPGGDIVGSYSRASEPTAVSDHGYLLTRNGTFYQVDFPGHINTVANRILPNGTILGCYHDTDRMNTMHGMMATREGFSEFDFSEFDMATTMHTGATPDGKRIAGYYTDMSGRGRGYLLDGINFIPFDVPGSTFTQGWDMNPSREIVGLYRDAVGKFHGFLVDDDWQFTTIDVPGATATRVFGINPRSDVAGSYVDATGKTHGFLGRRSDGHEEE